MSASWRRVRSLKAITTVALRARQARSRLPGRGRGSGDAPGTTPRRQALASPFEHVGVMLRKLPMDDRLVMGDPVAQRGQRPPEVLPAEALAVLASDAVQVLLPRILVFFPEERRPEAERECRHYGA